VQTLTPDGILSEQFLLCRANFKARVPRSITGHVQMPAEQVVQLCCLGRFDTHELK
jgi:hypothetical protein